MHGAMCGLIPMARFALQLGLIVSMNFTAAKVLSRRGSMNGNRKQRFLSGSDLARMALSKKTGPPFSNFLTRILIDAVDGFVCVASRRVRTIPIWRSGCGAAKFVGGGIWRPWSSRLCEIAGVSAW